MKILYIVSSPELNPYARTGYARHINETITHFRELGHEVRLHTTKIWSAPSSDSKRNSDSACVMMNLIKAMTPQFIWNTLRDLILLSKLPSFRSQLKLLINEFEPDLIYERTAYMVHFDMLMRHFRGLWFVEVNAPIIHERVELSGASLLLSVAKRHESKKLSCSHKVFTVSESLRHFLIENVRIEPSKIVANPNGVSMARFLSFEPTLSPDFTFGFVGSILPFHGVDELVRAFARINGKYPETSLLVVGDGEQLIDLMELAKMLGVDHAIRFEGSVNFDAIPRCIDRMKICIMPNSNWYGSPVKIFEYGAMAKPVIAPNKSPVREVIQNGVHGLLVSSESELFDAMEKLLCDHQTAILMGMKLQKRITDNFTWIKNAERILSAVALSD